ncbi:MAG: hypothetical protein ACI9RG_000395 [Sulfurimonas sp.]|jgi:hypothetical protein
MEIGTIFIIAIIVTIAILVNIYDSQKLKSANKNNEGWMEEDLKKFITDIKIYVKYCISEPINTEEIRHTSKLPIEKVIFVKRSLLYIEYLENSEDRSNEGQKILSELSNEIYFPNDLLIKYQNDSKEVLKLLKSRIHNN